MVFDEDDRARLMFQDPAAQFRTDRSARAGDQDGFPFQRLLDARLVELDLVPIQKIGWPHGTQRSPGMMRLKHLAQTGRDLEFGLVGKIAKRIDDKTDDLPTTGADGDHDLVDLMPLENSAQNLFSAKD